MEGATESPQDFVAFPLPTSAPGVTTVAPITDTRSLDRRGREGPIGDVISLEVLDHFEETGGRRIAWN